jgi:hypothetical protein
LHNNVENVFLNDDFCIYSVPRIIAFRKRAHWDGFSSFTKLFSFLSLDINFFANFAVEKKHFALPETARNSLP